MLIPPIHGTCNQSTFYIYAACDAKYFNEFGPAFIGSIKKNTTAGIHIHLFNPEQAQIELCFNQNVSVTWETVPVGLFIPASQNQLSEDELNRTHNAMKKGHDKDLLDRMQKTYYACARFIRLAELFNRVDVLELDIDAVVRKEIPRLTEQDFYIHHITGKKARYLAGGLYLNARANTKKFLTEYADRLKQSIQRDYIYWGLDQDLLDPIVPQYQHGQLPMSYIDWEMLDNSCVWTAKGTRKDLEIFKNEQRRYVF